MGGIKVAQGISIPPPTPSTSPEAEGWAAQAERLRHEGDYEAAEKLYRQLAEHQEATLGGGDARTQQSQYSTAVLCEQVGDFAEAERLYRVVQAAQEATVGGEHEATLRTRMGLINVLAEAGRGGEAEALCRELELTQTRLLGAAHRDTLRSRLNLALLLADRGELEPAERLCRGVEAAQAAALGAEDLDTLLTRYNRSQLLYEVGAPAAGRQRTRAIVHPRIANSRPAGRAVIEPTLPGRGGACCGRRQRGAGRGARDAASPAASGQPAAVGAGPDRDPQR
jgi:tetratricopeptide (TPR) repeat protein